MDSAYILNRRPFRDNRFIVDLLTQESGRITCVARVAKKRGKIMKGALEPFRRLGVAWVGKGQMPTLMVAEEQRRYLIQPKDLCKALYFNELILKLIPLFAPANDVFAAYQVSLHRLTAVVDERTLMQCEFGLLDVLGYSFGDDLQHQLGKPIEAKCYYRYSANSGLQLYEKYQQGVPISGALLIKWQQSEQGQVDQHEYFAENEYDQLRQFLNCFIDTLLVGKPLKSRKLVFL